MKEKKLSISVVIPYYKRKNLVNQILYEINNQAKITGLKTEVIVVDSLTDSKLLNINYENISIKIFDTINTLSSKRNYGIEKSKGEVIVCIDDDCLPKDGFLINHYKANLHSKVPTIFSGQEIISPIFKKPKCFFKFRTDNVFLVDSKKNKNKYEKIFQSRAMHFSFASKYKKEIPLFNENIKGYGWEDCIFFKDCLDCGIEIFECQSIIFHKLEETPDIFFKKQIFFGFWSYNALYRLNFLNLKKWQLLILNIIYKTISLSKPILNLIYKLIYKINNFYSYKLGFFNYHIQKLVYYFSILIGISASMCDSQKYNYD